MFRPRHMQTQPNGPDDFSLQLLRRACNFQNAEGIHDSLRQFYTLLASGAFSPRRAAVLGYLTSLLLRTLPAVYNGPFPWPGLSCPPPSWPNAIKPNPCPLRVPTRRTRAQREIRAYPENHTYSAVRARTKPTHTRMPAPARALTNEIAQRSSAQPMSLPPVHSTPPANAASTADYLNCGPGRPLPATRAEFAAQVLKSIASSPPIPVPNAASDFSRNCRIW